ncbi:MAG: murein biosynthesis integral membrane protein MurJ [bacterium]|nr:murein biosynthesis integral membrane protein MurJ [bacterium]
MLRHLTALWDRSRGVLLATTFASYALGLLRDRVFARSFGAGHELDAYQAAFLLPDFLFNFLVAGGLVAVFVPLFLEVKRAHPEYADRFAQTMATASSLLMLAVGVVLFIFAPSLVRLVAPGFDDASTRALVPLMRVLAFSPAIFAVSNAFGGILVAEKRFLTYGLAPVFYNAGIIVGTVVLAPTIGIMGAAVGTLFGAVLHMVIRLIELWRLKFPIRPALDFSLPEFRPFLRLMLPKMFSHPVELATFWGFTAIASTMSAGSIAVLNFARNFQSVPISLIGITLATVSFSSLSQLLAARDLDAFWREYRRTLGHIVLLSIASAAGLAVFGRLIIDILLGGGAFDASAVHQTAALLTVFAIAIPFEGASHLQARAFYAAKNTTIPLVGGVINLILSVGGAWLLVPVWGIYALPAGYALGSAAKVALLWLRLEGSVNSRIRQ